MQVILLMVTLLAISAYGTLVAVAGADSREGVDGEGALGRRRHHAQTWW